MWRYHIQDTYLFEDQEKLREHIDYLYESTEDSRSGEDLSDESPKENLLAEDEAFERKLCR